MSREPSYMPFVKAAQYLANISIDQDFRSELCKVVSTFFGVDVAAVAEKNANGEVVIQTVGKITFAIQRVSPAAASC